LKQSRIEGQPTPPLVPSRDELLTLMNHVCDGRLTQQECSRLEHLLANSDSDEAINLYLAFMELHAALSWRWHGSRQAMSPRKKVVQQPQLNSDSASFFDRMDAIAGRIASAVGGWLLTVGRSVPRRQG
jgi:hypothetical protein